MIPTVTTGRPDPRPDRPVLVLGPSLGTSAATLWGACAARLARDFDVVWWDLPGHGRSPGAPDDFTAAELARAVLAAVTSVLQERGEPDGTFAYAGNSVGGVVGLQLLLDAPERVHAAVLLCTGAQLGDAASWTERIDQVRASGTPSLVTASAGRWFGPGFLEREPEVGSALLHALSDTEDLGYAQVCALLAAFDVRSRLGEIATPVLAVAGADDAVAPPYGLRALADGVAHGRFVVLDGVAHLAPAEKPETVARLIREHCGAEAGSATLAATYDAGMAVRREVLGAAYVDRATAAATDLTREFQTFITTYAWGSVWTRPGLDRRSRSMITLTALVARGHHEELALHLRAARTNGLTDEEIGEVLLQSAIYCGVPDANTAFRIARETLAEMDAES